MSAPVKVTRALEAAIYVEAQLMAARNPLVLAIGASHRRSPALWKNCQRALAEIELALTRVRKTIDRERRRK